MEIQAKDVHEKLTEQAVNFLDVRRADEVQTTGIIAGAQWIPLDQLDEEVQSINSAKQGPLVIYCAGGVRSLAACKILQAHGFTQTQSMAGGLMAWMQQGFAVVPYVEEA